MAATVSKLDFPFFSTIISTLIILSMALHSLVEPPTKEALAGARRALETTRASVEEITSKIDAAEATLAQIVRESQYAIKELQTRRTVLEDQLSRTLAYLSPMRRLPMELLREIFVWSFEVHPCSAWVLAAVCTSWRRLALRIPLIWSKVSTFRLSPSSSYSITRSVWIRLECGSPCCSIVPVFSRYLQKMHELCTSVNFGLPLFLLFGRFRVGRRSVLAWLAWSVGRRQSLCLLLAFLFPPYFPLLNHLNR